jgi:hypothetical protein
MSFEVGNVMVLLDVVTSHDRALEVSFFVGQRGATITSQSREVLSALVSVRRGLEFGGEWAGENASRLEAWTER